MAETHETPPSHPKRRRDYDGTPPGYYDGIFREGFVVRRFWHRLKFQSVVSAIPADAKDILDIGCGPGSMASLMDGRVRCTGIDASIGQILYAAERYGTGQRAFLPAQLPHLPFEDNAFDAVTMVEVIEHLPLPVVEMTLAEVRRVLKPGGAFLLTTPNYLSAWPVLERLIAFLGAPDYDEQHLTRFTLHMMRGFLVSRGFSVMNIGAFFVLSPFASALSWKLGLWLHRAERRLAGKIGSLILASTRVSS